MAAAAEEAIAYDGRCRDDARPEIETRRLGRSARPRRRRRLPRQIGLGSSSARRSTATSSPPAGFRTPTIGGLARSPACRSPRRTSCAPPAPPTTRSAPISPCRCEIVRIYSTSGTTGAPSYIPLTSTGPRRLDRDFLPLLRASGVARGERIVTTYNAGPFVAGATLDAFDRARPLPHSGRRRQHRPADDRRRALLKPDAAR
jgi:hypothetical protein